MAKRKGIRDKGTGCIVKRGARFYLKLRINGKTKNSLLRGDDDMPVTTRKDAEAAAALLLPVLRASQKEEIALYIAEAKKLRRSSTLPIAHIWDAYLSRYTRPDSGDSTLTSYCNILHRFTTWLYREHPEIRLASQISSETANGFFSYIWNIRRVSGKTFNLYRQALNLIFTHILEVSGLESNPFASIRNKPVNTESRLPFTEEQVTAIFAGFDKGFFFDTEVMRMGTGRKHQLVKRTLEFKPMFRDEMRVLLMLCCWTGCRGQDGCLMQWSNVDLDRRVISYIPRKTARKTNYQQVSLPLHPNLYAALVCAQAFRGRNRQGEDFIVPSVASRYMSNPGGVQEDVRKIIHCAIGCPTTADSLPDHRACRANRYSLHSFRHTFVSFCANAGVPLDVVAAIVGHTSSAMTRHYAHISDAAKQNALEQLPTLSADENNSNRDALLAKLNVLTEEQLSELLDNLTRYERVTS